MRRTLGGLCFLLSLGPINTFAGEFSSTGSYDCEDQKVCSPQINVDGYQFIFGDVGYAYVYPSPRYSKEVDFDPIKNPDKFCIMLRNDAELARTAKIDPMVDKIMNISGDVYDSFYPDPEIRKIDDERWNIIVPTIEVSWTNIICGPALPEETIKEGFIEEESMQG